MNKQAKRRQIVRWLEYQNTRCCRPIGQSCLSLILTEGQSSEYDQADALIEEFQADFVLAERVTIQTSL